MAGNQLLTHLLTFVQASARAVTDARAARAGSAMDWAVNAPLLARAHAYRFGMHRVLDGLAALIDNRRIPPGPKIVESES